MLRCFLNRGKILLVFKSQAHIARRTLTSGAAFPVAFAKHGKMGLAMSRVAETKCCCSLSSLASVVTNDSGIQGDTDMVDLKPPPAFLFPSQQSQPQPQPTKDSKFG